MGGLRYADERLRVTSFSRKDVDGRDEARPRRKKRKRIGASMNLGDGVQIELAPSATEEIRALVEELETVLAAEYLPEQRHGLAIDALFQPHIQFFLAWLDGAAVGCGGVALFSDFAEVKRMYVRDPARRQGVAGAILARLEEEARDAGLSWLRLETGDNQIAAMQLYARAGFSRCPAFGDYLQMTPQSIATSVFFEKRIG
jgi:putative acetyltransferase